MAVPRLKASLAEPGRVTLERAHARPLGRDVMLRRLLAAGDALAVLIALALALFVSGRPDAGSRLLWGAAVLPLLIVLFKVYGLYDRDVKRISHSTVDDLPWLLHATMIGALLVWLYSKLSPMHRLDFGEILLFGVFVMVCVTVGRLGVRRAVLALLGPESALLVGGGEMADVFIRKLEAHPECGLEVVGVLATAREPTSQVRVLPVLGVTNDLAAVAARHDATRVIVSPLGLEEDELKELLRNCRELALKLSLLPQLSDVLGPAVEIDDVEGVTVLGVNPPWLPRSSRALKRTMDISLAAIMLALSAPIMVLIAAAIKLDGPGPILFTQERVGKGGKRFRLLKFRTMVPDAELRRADLLAHSSDTHWLMIANDPRITRLGRHLRQLSIDELPQLWNVLRGEMSLVGPRPLVVVEDEHVQGWARGRLDLTPGITGYWQVLGRARIPFEEMVKLDYLYVMNWSLWTDLRLIMRTLPTVLSRRGAN
jgi:exopolysaccharide biosynthesis polyprenyl glycosylphosphotransferase